MAKFQSQGHEVRNSGMKRKEYIYEYKSFITIHSTVMAKVKVFADKKTDRQTKNYMPLNPQLHGAYIIILIY